MTGEAEPLNIVLLDSCIVIDYIKGIEAIKKQVDGIARPCINFIVEMELLRGSVNKLELKKISRELSAFHLLSFHNSIARLSTDLVKLFYLSHNLHIADAIVAATAMVYKIPLFTHNRKDFRYIPELILFGT